MERDILTAELCVESYREKSDTFVDRGDLRYAVVDNNGVTDVVFRGSANLMNWRRNFRALPSIAPCGHIAHLGFAQPVKILREEITRALRGKEVVRFGGHSFGAAIARGFAQIIPSTAVTFGGPRYYWRWSKVNPVPHRRYVADDDPVPMVPHLLYEHVEYPIVLPDKDGVHLDWDDHDMAKVYLARLREHVRRAPHSVA